MADERRATGSSFSTPFPEGRQYFTFFFQILRIKHVPPSFKGDLYVKWSRGKTSGKTDCATLSDQKLSWKEPPVASFPASLKLKGGEWGAKSVTFSLKQIKKGWKTAKDVGRLKVRLGEFVGDQAKTHDLVMSSTFSPAPVFEVVVTSRIDSNKQVDESEMSLAENDDTGESRTWDTVSFADLSEGEGNNNLVELRKKYDTLRRRAFQLRDALIKWQNYANKLKDSNQFLNNRISDLEKGREEKENEKKELEKQLFVFESEYEKAKKELSECEKEIKDTLLTLSQEKNEKSVLSGKLHEGDDSGLEEAKGHAAKVTEVYESQTLQLQEKEKEAKNLKKIQKEKDDEISRLTANLHQSLKARSPGVHDAHSSLFKSVIGLLILVLVGMFYTSMTSKT